MRAIVPKPSDLNNRMKRRTDVNCVKLIPLFTIDLRSYITGGGLPGHANAKDQRFYHHYIITCKYNNICETEKQVDPSIYIHACLNQDRLEDSDFRTQP